MIDLNRDMNMNIDCMYDFHNVQYVQQHTSIHRQIFPIV